MTLRELHLFAGVGGGILGGRLLGHRCVGAVELDPYCRRVLEARQADGTLERFPIHDDVRTFDGRPWRGHADIVCGGFPCQDISVAGKGAGLAGARSGLWLEMLRVVREVEPRYVFVENSPMLRTRGLGTVLRGLAELGFNAEWDVVAAADAGAPHLRKRLWLLGAHPDRRRQRGERLEEHAEQPGAQRHEPDGLRAPGRRGGADVADAGGARLPAPEREDVRGARGRDEGRAAAERGGGPAQRGLGDSADGLPTWLGRLVSPWGDGWEDGVPRTLPGAKDRVPQLRALGNAQVPAVAAMAFRELHARLTP